MAKPRQSGSAAVENHGRRLSPIGLSRTAWRHLRRGCIVLVVSLLAWGDLARRHGLPVLRSTAFWAALWVIQARFSPRWLIESNAGLATAVQVQAATMVALYAILLGTVFVISQQVSANYSSRAALVLLEDDQLIAMIGRALILSSAILLVSGRVPDRGVPSEQLAAGATTLSIATAVVLLSSANRLLLCVGRYGAPRAFAQWVLNRGRAGLRRKAPEEVIWKVLLLSDMARAGVRRGESTTLRAAVEALSGLQDEYYEQAAIGPEVRRRSFEDGTAIDGWMGEELAVALEGLGSELLRLEGPGRDIDVFVGVLSASVERAIERGEEHEAIALMDCAASLGTSVHQVAASGAFNLLPQMAEVLADAEAAASRQGKSMLQAEALARLAMVLHYPFQKFEIVHPLLLHVASRLSASPPWDAAIDILVGPAWQVRWANQSPTDPAELIAVALAAKDGSLFSEEDKDEQQGP